jgi:branched-chain amino acid transport system permease protein
MFGAFEKMAFPFTQLLVNSLVIGSIYALVAVGFSLIYQSNRFMHFGHGAVVALGSYLAFLFFTTLGFGFIASALFTVLLCSIAGAIMYFLVIAPLQNRRSSTLILLVASIALLILLENFILLVFGSDVKTIKLFTATKGMELFGATITMVQVIILSASLFLLAMTYLLMNHTGIGRDLRAVSNNPELAEVIGINKKRILASSFVIASAIAGVAGLLIGLEQAITPSIGTPLMVKSFSGAVIGGVSSIPASIAGSYIVGAAENFGVWWIPSGYKDAIAFTLLFAFLLFRPQGLFGKSLDRT